MLKHSIVLISFKRDNILKENLEHIFLLLEKSKYPLDRVEIILVDNNEDNINRSSYIEKFPIKKYVKLYNNLGVAGGRNEAIKRSNGQYLTFIDDDAFIYPENFLFIIEDVFKRNIDVGILAFKSINFYTRKIDRKEFPHTNKKLNPDQSFYTFRFIGVTHSIRKEIFNKVGLYPYDYFYGMEEFDLAYRAINNNYKILYIPYVYVYHKKVPQGRLSNKQLWENILLNKLKLNYKFLPNFYYFVSSSLWIIYVLIKSNFKINIFNVLKKFKSWKKNTRKQSLSKQSIYYIIKKCGGNLFK